VRARPEMPGAGRWTRPDARDADAVAGLAQALRQELDLPGYVFGTHRAVSPAETLRRIRPLLRPTGITRLANITGLDWIGIPVYQAIRPRSRLLAVSQGKGLTRAQAQVSALMESLEGFHAEEVTLPTVRDTVGAVRVLLPYDPYALPLFHPSGIDDRTVLDWCPATDLWTGDMTWVPRELCVLDFRLAARYHWPRFRMTTNGLASGNTVAEAIVHGLCEVVERDSCWRGDRDPAVGQRHVMPDSITPRLARRVLDRFDRAGIETRIVDMSGPTGLPCFEVWIDHPDGPAPARGSGCHPSRLTALLRALTEAAQSRLTYIAGSRDDIDRRYYRTSTGRVWARRPPVPKPPAWSYASAPTMPVADFRAQVQEIVHRVRAVTGMAPLAVDLRRPEFGLPVVLVIAPGLGARQDI
jgi:YcaO-like protein with predicted kinase domain